MLTTAPRMGLGNCSRCGNKLAVRQQNRYRMVNDQRILLDEQGKDLHQDSSGRLSGRPALEWVVSCSDCGREHRDHPHQHELEQAAIRRKQEEQAALQPSTQARPNYTEVSVVDALERRNAALEGRLAALEKELAELRQATTAPAGRGSKR